MSSYCLSVSGSFASASILPTLVVPVVEPEEEVVPAAVVAAEAVPAVVVAQAAPEVVVAEVAVKEVMVAAEAEEGYTPPRYRGVVAIDRSHRSSRCTCAAHPSCHSSNWSVLDI